MTDMAQLEARFIRALGPIALAAFVLFAAFAAPPNAAQLAQTSIQGPTGSGQFGKRVVFLPSGDFVVSDPNYDAGAVADVGAVHLYSGSDFSLIATLTGSTAFDQIGVDGSDPGIRVLSNGNYLVRSPNWDQPTPLISNVGALTLCDGSTGCSGVVSAANSAVGSSASDGVGALVHVLANGNYVIQASAWDDPTGAIPDAGAVRFCTASVGCTGPLSNANSLVGSRASDSVGFPVPLTNGNYVVVSRLWDNPSPNLRANAGAATFCSGTTGCVGTISSANSLVGTSAEDQMGERAVALIDGSYVVHSSLWNGVGLSDAGATTWCNGTTGCAPGPVTAANSLTGAVANDQVGSSAAATPLPGGAYTIHSPQVDRPLGDSDVGAVTWCAAGGVGCTGATVTTANSLVGTIFGDLFRSVVVSVGSGAFTVGLKGWDDPVSLAANAGAVTYCSAATHCQGMTPTAANSLVGASSFDNVGDVVALSNGNYVVGSIGWNDGPLNDVGAATFCNGTTGCQGPVSPGNSYTGLTTGDQVGGQVGALSNGNYVVVAGSFDNGATTNVGAVRHCSGTSGCFGTPGAGNALVGTTAANFVGSSGIVALPNGNYLVRSPSFDDGGIDNVGAVTWCSGTGGCTGAVSLANSLLGGTAFDQISDAGVTAFPDDSYAVQSSLFDNATGPVANAGAYTFGNGDAGTTGRVGVDNSVVGSVASDLTSFDYDAPRARYVVGRGGSNRAVIVEVPEPALAAAIAAAVAALVTARRRSRGGE